VQYKNLKNNLLLVFASLLFSLVLFEFATFLFTEMGFLKIDRPAYSFDSLKKRFWADINKDFGVWHEPFSQYHHRKSCFDVWYHANSYGARDKERTFDSKNPRWVVLGDSFVEGYGVADGKRFTDLLENETSTEYLNFGTAGHFGTIQYYLLYKTLAKKFSHTGVIIGILPANDFFDNDIEAGKKVHFERYRPYFVGDYPDYQLVYFNEESNQKKGVVSDLWRYVRGFLRGYTYSYNAIHHLIDTQRVRHAMPDQKVYSGYYDFKEKEFELMKYTLEKIIEEAKEKEIVILTIPVTVDLMRYEAQGESPLSRKLKEFSEKNGVTYIDLLPLMHDYTKNWGEYFLPCDHHWNEYGSFVASQVFKTKLSEYAQKKN
jgi:hypothetical protein